MSLYRFRKGSKKILFRCIGKPFSRSVSFCSSNKFDFRSCFFDIFIFFCHEAQYKKLHFLRCNIVRSIIFCRTSELCPVWFLYGIWIWIFLFVGNTQWLEGFDRPFGKSRSRLGILFSTCYIIATWGKIYV